MSWLFSLFDDGNEPSSSSSNNTTNPHAPNPPPRPAGAGTGQRQGLSPNETGNGLTPPGHRQGPPAPPSDLFRTVFNDAWGSPAASSSGVNRPTAASSSGQTRSGGYNPSYNPPAPSIPSSSRPRPSSQDSPMMPNRPSWQDGGPSSSHHASSRGFSITWSSGSRPQTRSWHSTGQGANPMADMLLGLRNAGAVPVVIPAGGGFGGGGQGMMLNGLPLAALAGGAGGLAGPLGGSRMLGEPELGSFSTPRGPPPPDPLDPHNQPPSRYGDEVHPPTSPVPGSSRPDGLASPPHAESAPVPSSRTSGQPGTAKCGCCGLALRYPAHSSCFRCTVCGIIWDLPSPHRSVSQSDSTTDGFRMTRDHVEALKTLRDASSTVGENGGRGSNKVHDEFADMASALLSAMFSSVSSLSSAFLRPPPADTPTSPSKSSFDGLSSTKAPAVPSRHETRLDLKTLRGFYDGLATHPLGRDLLIGNIERFLARPGRDLFAIIDAADGPEERQAKLTQRIHSSRQFLWAIVLLECPLFTSYGSLGIPPPTRTVLLARLFGLISALPNARHQHLVSFWKSGAYAAPMLEGKVNLLNGFIGERIQYWIAAGGLPGQGEERGSLGKGLAGDWAMRASSRVMALFVAANNVTRKLPLTSFYNLTIDVLPPVSLISDFETWERHTETSQQGRYTFCAYPFLISLASKITLLGYEQKRSMGQEARTAFIDSIMGRRFAPPVLQINVRREQIVNDSLREIEAAGDDLKKLLRISFVNEEGLDGGGLKKEWFLLLCRQLLDPAYGMFTPADPDSNMIWFNPASFETASEYNLIGVILGLAIYNRATLDVPLPLACFKKLLGVPVDLSDLAALRPALAKGLQSMLDWQDGDVQDVFCRSMVGEYEAFGEVMEWSLVQGGENIPVTNANRADYVRLYVDFVLSKSIQHQFESFAAGFRRVASGNALSLFRAEEIELLIRGSEEPLDLAQLKSVTVYEGFPQGENDPTIRLFWNFFASLDAVGQRKLLAFITGSDRIPATGTAELRLKITRNGDGTEGRLPSSHTCFDQLLLPAFRDQDLLNSKLRAAMEESEGFGLR